ncbi:MAG: hypothetical protein ACI9R3_006237, partial [Verrucomicrobiales bacterium]
VITSRAENEAAVEFAKASAKRPQVVGKALAEISQDKVALEALLKVLEIDKIVKGDSRLTLIPAASGGDSLMAQLIAAENDAQGQGRSPGKKVRDSGPPPIT